MVEEPYKVLLVEDNPGDARLVEIALSEPGPVHFRLERVGLLSAALRRLEKEEFDLVLLDLSLPDSQGLETVVAIRKQSPQVPVVVLTGLDDEQSSVEALHMGAQDYLVKGTATGETLRRTIRYAVERRKIMADLKALRENGQDNESSLKHAIAAYRTMVDAKTTPFADDIDQPLRERRPRFVDDIAELYGELLEEYVSNGSPHGVGSRLTHLVQRLREESAGARDVIDIHLQALKSRLAKGGLEAPKPLALNAQIFAVEVLGRLLNHYKRQDLMQTA
ncbi:MAG: response regulator [candidate division KSB1 bacterium]|nr:response regulator [candidate division KSB1 bacterium]MDZ7386811.1 response regulator [candidate division KSB1 bacterium]MDZ7392219.1 response regulator [candidate division KSB1 bacterium]MDZ7413783.1 response regulator [candidate division KSB1 bacterium]